MMKNSKRSDRELAKIIGVSQPTITRMRQRLEKTGYIQDYSIIPNLEKLGFEITAFTFINNVETGARKQELSENADKWIESNPKIVFAATGDGLNGKNFIMISMHKNFTDYSEFMSDFRSKWAVNIRDIDSFLVPLRGKLPKRFAFKYLESIR